MSGMQLPMQTQKQESKFSLHRFKNFEAGRLTSLSEVQGEKTIVQGHQSEYGSEIDLSKAEEKFVGGTTEAEIHVDFDPEEHGEFVSTSIGSTSDVPQSIPTRSTTKSPTSSIQCVVVLHHPRPKHSNYPP
jgi:hypothetical protein